MAANVPKELSREYERLMQDRRAFESFSHVLSSKMKDEYMLTRDKIKKMEFCRQFIEKYGDESIDIPFSKYFTMSVGCENCYTEIGVSFYLTMQKENDPHTFLYDNLFDSHSELGDWEKRLIETLCWPVFSNVSEIRIRDFRDIDDVISFATNENDHRARLKKLFADTADAYIDQLIHGSYVDDYYFLTEKDIEEKKQRAKEKESILLKKESYEFLKDANGGKYPKKEMEEKYRKICREAQKYED